jgi:hypothetical protein
VGIVTTSSERTFIHPPELLYDFVSNPANWTKTYPGGPQIRNVPEQLPLKVGDTWDEAHPDPEKRPRVHVAIGDGDAPPFVRLQFCWTPWP